MSPNPQIRATKKRPIGLIAGEGELPRLVARNIHATGTPLVTIALRGWADPALREYSSVFRWHGIAKLGGWIRTLRRADCRSVIMVGRVKKTEMFAGPRWRQWLQYIPDLTSIKVWYFRTRDKRNDSLLAAVADEMERYGIMMMDSTAYCQEALATAGLLTDFEPPQFVRDDAEFAWPLAKKIGAMDIGQSVAVKEREIIAVEAIEGTDKLIKRAGELCPAGGWTLVKIAKPNQDMRFDVPTIGPNTIDNLAKAKAVGLVLEAGKTLILEKEKTIARANENRIAIIGRNP